VAKAWNKPYLLIDGDVLCFRAASAAQKCVEDDSGQFFYLWAGKGDAERILENLLEKLLGEFGTDAYTFFLTEPGANWRNDVLPTYKQNRSYGVADRPMCLTHLKDYAKEHFNADWELGYEADDLIGIKATSPMPGGNPDGRCIIVSADKDLKSIPGQFHRYGIDAPGRVHIRSRRDADLFHLQQTLAGDIVDGYSGCPTIGMDRAEGILADPHRLDPLDGVVTKGPRKGQRTIKWMPRPTTDYWQCVVSQYEKQGLTEDDALVQARVARILRFDDMRGQFEGPGHNLWSPDMLCDELRFGS